MKYKKKLSPEFKTQVALEAIRESMPLAEIAKKYEITPSIVSELKEEFLAGASQVLGPLTPLKFDNLKNNLSNSCIFKIILLTLHQKFKISI